jgi:hypothetical protein
MTGNSAAPGIIPRAIGDLFRHIETAVEKDRDSYFYVRLSFVELYNNNFRNLLENASRESSNSQTNDSKGLFSELDEMDGNAHQANPVRAHLIVGLNENRPKKPHHSSHDQNKIEVRESTTAGVFLSGFNLRIPVTSAVEAFKLVAQGNKLRATGTTQCNDVSSRSHAILTFHVESKVTVVVPQSAQYTSNNDNSDGDSYSTTVINNEGATSNNNSTSGSKIEVRLGKIHLVDLAGSERLSLSGAEGSMKLETQAINLSLTALGNVLSALSRNAQFAMIQKSPSSTIGGTVSGVSGASGIGDGSSTSGSGSGLGSSTYVSRNESMSGPVSSSTSLSSRPSTPPKGANKGSHLLPVPYRNSKLTHLLKDSLGGNSKTTMITTIRSGLDYIKQTEMSLMYASRAKKIVNTTEINLHSNMSESSIHAVATEIDRLQRSLGEKSYELERLVMIMGKKASLVNENLLRQQLLTLTR